MVTIISALIVSFIVGFLLVRLQSLHQHFTGDHDLSGVQKFHAISVPRVGGLAILAGMLCGILSRWTVNGPIMQFGLLILVSASPVFVAGFVEDVTKKVGVKVRLLCAAASGILAGYFFDAWLVDLQFFGLDALLQIPVVSVIFTAFAVAGVTNAFNIIDGYNGLVGVVSAVILLALAYVGFQVQDYAVMASCLAAFGAILGFLFWNYPKGLIFLGDGGAYLIGFLVAELSILLVIRNPQVSKWFPVLLCFYPIFETLFTIYRRLMLKKGGVGHPDSAHLHQIIYKRVVRLSVIRGDAQSLTQRNSMTSPYLWVLSSLAVLPALLFWQYKVVLQFFIALFAVTYVWLYWSIIHFKVPKWMLLKSVNR